MLYNFKCCLFILHVSKTIEIFGFFVKAETLEDDSQAWKA